MPPKTKGGRNPGFRNSPASTAERSNEAASLTSPTVSSKRPFNINDISPPNARKYRERRKRHHHSSGKQQHHSPPSFGKSTPPAQNTGSPPGAASFPNRPHAVGAPRFAFNRGPTPPQSSNPSVSNSSFGFAGQSAGTSPAAKGGSKHKKSASGVMSFTMPRNNAVPESFSFAAVANRIHSSERSFSVSPPTSGSTGEPSKFPVPSVADVQPTTSPQFTFATPPMQPLLSSPLTAVSSEWVCVVCSKPKDLPGDHLRGRDTVRSDCWPCGKKQIFNRSKDGGLGGSITDVAGSGSKSMAVAVTSQPVFKSSNRTPPMQPFQLPPAVTTSASNPTVEVPEHARPAATPVDERFAKFKPSLLQENAMVHPDGDSTLFRGTWDLSTYLRTVLSVQRMRLHAQPGSNEPLQTWFEGTPSQLMDGGVRVLWGNDGALYAQRHDFRYLGPVEQDKAEPLASQGRQQKCISMGHLAVIGQTALVADKMAAAAGCRVGRVFCNNSMAFAALAAYYRHTGCTIDDNGEVAEGESVFVCGPAADPTQPSTKLDDIAVECGGIGVFASVHGRMQAVKGVYEETQVVVTPNGAAAHAIRKTVDATNNSQWRRTDGIVDLVLLGKSVPWDAIQRGSAQ